MNLSTADWRRIQVDEREALLRTLEHVDPTAPTLCDGWTASTITAHLVLSEAAGGIPLALTYPLRRVMGPRTTRAALDRAARWSEPLNRRYERRDWMWLLDRLASGPPAVYSLPWLARIRLLEVWIHHEDLRRPADPTPRSTTASFDDALVEAMLTVMRMPELASSRRGVEAVLPDGRSFVTGGDVTVRVSGTPGEVLLWAAGRTGIADVTVEGDVAAVDALTSGLRF